jgi:hypothetical protein
MSAGAGSFRLDVGRPDDLAPLLGFVGDEFAEVGKRAPTPINPLDSARHELDHRRKLRLKKASWLRAKNYS